MRTLGILINSAGIDNDTQMALIQIVNNTVKNVTAFGIDVRGLAGQVTIQGNTIKMGNIGNANVPVAGIRCTGHGIYMITNHNSIYCGFEKAAGIRLVDTNQVGPDLRGGADTRVADNDISMSRPDGASADNANAGIVLTGNVPGKTVSNNSVSGRASAALSLTASAQGLLPSGSTLKGNRHAPQNFTPSVADIFIEDSVRNTHVIAPDEFLFTQQQLAGTILDGGLGTTTIDGDYSIVG